MKAFILLISFLIFVGCDSSEDKDSNLLQQAERGQEEEGQEAQRQEAQRQEAQRQEEERSQLNKNFDELNKKLDAMNEEICRSAYTSCVSYCYTELFDTIRNRNNCLEGCSSRHGECL